MSNSPSAHTAMAIGPPRARLLARARRQRWYRREKAGIAIAPTPYDAAIVDVLVALGYLPDDPVSPRQVGEAMAAALRSLIR